jgi:Fe-S-cluster containining protein
MKILKQKIIRHILIYMFPKRIKHQIELREGKCLRCGKCCKLVFTCPMLVGSHQQHGCRIYPHRSRVCSQFPISNEDIKDVNYKCGYSFRTVQ